MRICVLEDAYVDSISPLSELDPPADPAFYLPGHICERHTLTKANAVRTIINLSQRGFDLFLNLCDGAWDEDRPGIEVVQALERLGLPFTGAGSAFYDPTRESMKAVCRYNGVGTPNGMVVRDGDDVIRASRELTYPLIVKHPNSYSSIGLTRASRVENAESLQLMANRMIAEYGGALVEEFIEGREFTVLVAENADDPEQPFVYRPIEFLFPPGESFKHFDLKWKEYGGMQAVPCADPALDAALRDAARSLFVGLEGTGYGRCDIRVNRGGGVYVLEINPNCGVFYPPSLEGSADFILLNDPAAHAGFAEAIFSAALKRAAERRLKWRISYRKELGYGMIATSDIPAGEVLVKYENSPHVLVTRQHVQAHWRGQLSEWFARFAYPLTDEIYVTWSPDPTEWKPINHSCDPNAWLTGLDLTARRVIRQGEEITVDYATFCGETMAAFDCHCGSPDCRGTVSGTDYQERFIERYGHHVSDYVRRKRQEGVPGREG